MADAMCIATALSPIGNVVSIANRNLQFARRGVPKI